MKMFIYIKSFFFSGQEVQEGIDMQIMEKEEDLLVAQEDLLEIQEIQTDEDLLEIKEILTEEDLLVDHREILGTQTGEVTLGMIEGVKMIVGDTRKTERDRDVRKRLKLVNQCCKFINLTTYFSIA
jgi:hypothetical protein